MAFQLSPGVLVTEEDRSTVVPSVATTAGAFSGAFAWGPVNKVTSVESEAKLVEQFGTPNDTTAGYFFTAANFLSYGNNLNLVRVVDKGVAQNAVSTPDGQVTGITNLVSSNDFLRTDVTTAVFSAPPTGGTQATANVVLNTTGSLYQVDIGLRGFGYNVPPTITFVDPSGGGTGAEATATIGAGQVSIISVVTSGNNYNTSSNIVIQNQDSTSANAQLVIHFKLKDIQINNGGTNVGPFGTGCNVVVSGGTLVAGGSHANVIPIITGNVVTGFTIVNNGNGYIQAPNIILNRLDGNTGTATSFTANLGYGIVNSITIVNPGAGGYSSTPNVTINKNNSLGGTTATATARIIAQLNDITLDSIGGGYSSNTTAVVTPASADIPYITSNATATAIIGYGVSGVTIINAGAGYTTVPNVTISSTGNATATATTVLVYDAPLIENRDDYDTSHSTGGYIYKEFAAKYPGALGNTIKVSMADYNTFTGWQYSNQFNSAPLTSSSVSTRGGIRDEIHLVVVDATGVWSGSAGTILEKYSYLSKASDGKNSDGSTNYYKDVINNSSKYIWVLDHPTNTSNWGTTATSKTFDGLTANITSTLSGGVSGDSVSSANILAGYDLFSNDELYDVSLIPMGPTTSAGAVNSVISLAETRRDCVVFASPQYSDVVNTTSQADKIVTYRDTLTSSSFAVLDSGWKYQYDRYNDKYRYVPLNGDTAGLAARTDYVSDPWFSPAGYNRGIIKNVVKLSYSPSKSDRDTLYKKGINPVVTFPGQGTLLFGDKTLLARPSAFDRINVRRLFIVLEKAIATASKFQLFEFNDPFTRAQFRNLVEPFLRDVQGRRGITDFRVVCDETNNTGEIIDRNEFVADIFIKPARAINFIQLNFIATRSGVSFEEVGA
jgi:hypothetical protein